MNPTPQDMSILSLVLGASAVVQGIMLLLLIVSFMSWYYIFLKWMTIRAEKRKASDFESSFWSGSSLNDLYQAALNDRHNAGALERIFESGLREFNKLRDQHLLESKEEQLLNRVGYAKFVEESWRKAGRFDLAKLLRMPMTISRT